MALSLLIKGGLSLAMSQTKNLNQYFTLQTRSLQKPLNLWYAPQQGSQSNYDRLVPPLSYYLQYILASNQQPNQELEETAILDQIDEIQTQKFSIKARGSSPPEEFTQKMRPVLLFLDILILSSGSITFGFLFWNRLHTKLKYSAILLLVISPTFILYTHGLFSFHFVAIGLLLISISAALKSSFIIAGIFFMLAYFFESSSVFYGFPFVSLASARNFNLDFIRSKPYQPSLIIEILGRGKLALILQRSFDFATIALSILVPAFIILFPFLQYPSSLLDLVSSLYLSRAHNPLTLSIWSGGQSTGLIMGFFLWIMFSLPSLIALMESPFPRRFTLAVSICSISYSLFSYALDSSTILYPLITSHLLLFERERILTLLHLISLLSLQSQFKAANLTLFYYLALFIATPLIYTIERSLPACDDHARLKHSSFLPALRDAFHRKTLTNSLMLNLQPFILLILLIGVLLSELLDAAYLVSWILTVAMLGVWVILNAKIRIVEDDAKTVIDFHSFTYSYELKFE